MGRRRKLLERILSGKSDTNMPFEQARALLLHLGFEERTKGKHQHKFFRPDVEELINLQEDPSGGGKCKPYQVKQLREVLLKYNVEKEVWRGRGS